MKISIDDAVCVSLGRACLGNVDVIDGETGTASSTRGWDDRCAALSAHLMKALGCWLAQMNAKTSQKVTLLTAPLARRVQPGQALQHAWLADGLEQSDHEAAQECRLAQVIELTALR